MASGSKRAKKTSNREEEPLVYTQSNVLELKGEGTVDNLKDHPPSFQEQIDNINRTLLEQAKALTALQDMPAILNNLSSVLGPRVDVEQEEYYDHFSDGGDDDIDNDLLTKFMASEGAEIPEGTGHNPDDEMLDILNVSQPCNEFGENLSEEVAKSFCRLSSNRPSKERIEKLRDEYKPPENCKLLAVPRVNPEIWPQLRNRSRTSDLSFQQHASFISQASVAVSKIADKIFKDGKQMPKELGQELLRLCMDTGSILGLASQEMSAKRKLELKPFLNKEFASICATKNPTTEWLFGDNVLDQMKASKNAANIVKPAFGPAFRAQTQRFTPYKPRQNLNYRRPSFPEKGGQQMNPSQQQRKYPYRPPLTYQGPARRQN